MKLLKLFTAFYLYTEMTVGSHMRINNNAKLVPQNPTISLNQRRQIRVPTLGRNEVFSSNLWTRGRPVRNKSGSIASLSTYRGRSRLNEIEAVRSQLLHRQLMNRIGANIPTLSPKAIHIQTRISGGSVKSQEGKPQSVLNGLQKPVEPTSSQTQSSNTVQDSPLMLLINSRDISFRSQAEEDILSNHLLALENIAKADQQNALKYQLEYIDTIQDIAMKRELLKLFVKDMVEKSGFLSPSADIAGVDTSEMMALHDTIQEITDRFQQQSVTSEDNIQFGSNGKVSGAISNTLLNNRNITQDRFNKALSSYSGRNAIQDVTISSLNSRLPSSNAISTFGRSGTISGRDSAAIRQRNRIRDQVGKSIFGVRPVPRNTRPITGQITVQIQPTSVDKREPLGGTDPYWTHLRSGLADLLCGLCQQQALQACIDRYCNKSDI